jgi:hypothetical protein
VQGAVTRVGYADEADIQVVKSTVRFWGADAAVAHFVRSRSNQLNAANTRSG